MSRLSNSNWLSIAVSVFVLSICVSTSNAAAPPAAPKAAAKPASADTARTVVVVNDSVISNFDIEQRARLLLITSGQPASPEMIKRVREQVKNSLIDEMLQTQEAFKYKIQIPNEDVDKSIARIAQQNNMQVADIFKTLENGGVSRSALQTQLRAEQSWQRLVQGRLASRVSVSPEEVQQVLDRTTANANKAQYLVSEIFISAEAPEQEAEARKTMETVRGQLQQGAPFSSLARQFSQASSAASGGDIGWIVQGQLGPEIDGKLSQMRPGTISDPIKTSTGLYLIALRQKQTAVGSKPEANDQPQDVPAAPTGPAQVKVIKGPSAEIGLARVLIPLDAGASKAKQEAARDKAIKMYRGANGCGGALQSLAQSVGVKVNDMGKLPFKDLQPEFRKILSETPNGRSTPPLRSGQGIEMFVICSGGAQVQVTQAPGGPGRPGAPKTEAFKMPTKEDIENRLFQQQLAMLSRRYLRDLRRDATIEIRE